MMAYNDVRTMIALARDGISVDSWRTQVVLGARLLASDRRMTQVRIALAVMRPEGAFLRDDGFLSDLAQADAATAHDLVYARYLASVPLATHIARTVLHPARMRGERTISRHALSQALNEHLSTCSAGTRARSLSAIGSEFARAGVLRTEKNGSLEFTGRQPAALALFYLLRDDLRDRQEASDQWLSTSSLAAALFLVPPETMRVQIDALVAIHRLHRSYYGGEPRILAA